MTASKRRLIWFIAPALLALAIGAWLLTPPSVDLSNLSKEEEPFRSMAMPHKEVVSLVFDDGSDGIEVRITDALDNEFWIIFPHEAYAIITPYKTALGGNTKQINAGSLSPLKTPARAKAIAIQLLNKHEPPGQFVSNQEVATRLSNSSSEIGSRFYWGCRRILHF